MGLNGKTKTMLQLEKKHKRDIDSLIIQALNRDPNNPSMLLAAAELRVSENTLRYLCYRRGIAKQERWIKAADAAAV